VRPEEGPLIGTLDYYGELMLRRFEASGKIDWVEMTAAAYRELAEGRTSCSGEDGYAALETFVAAHVSGERGLPMRLPLGTALDVREFPIA